jgi:hypothetical protein
MSPLKGRPTKNIHLLRSLAKSFWARSEQPLRYSPRQVENREDVGLKAPALHLNPRRESSPAEGHLQGGALPCKSFS